MILQKAIEKMVATLQDVEDAIEQALPQTTLREAYKMFPEVKHLYNLMLKAKAVQNLHIHSDKVSKPLQLEIKSIVNRVPEQIRKTNSQVKEILKTYA